MAKKNNITFEDGSPAPFVQSGEPVIKLNSGIPRMGSPEFIEQLKEWHAKHNGDDAPTPYRVTEKGKKAMEK